MKDYIFAVFSSRAQQEAKEDNLVQPDNSSSDISKKKYMSQVTHHMLLIIVQLGFTEAYHLEQGDMLLV